MAVFSQYILIHVPYSVISFFRPEHLNFHPRRSAKEMVVTHTHRNI
jgi:hypothetical protein